MKPKAPFCLLFTLILSGTAALNTPAGPLRNTDVPQDPAWIAHVDCDALRGNALGKFLLADEQTGE